VGIYAVDEVGGLVRRTEADRRRLDGSLVWATANQTEKVKT
jgi:hypothetical protein